LSQETTGIFKKFQAIIWLVQYLIAASNAFNSYILSWKFSRLTSHAIFAFTKSLEIDIGSLISHKETESSILYTEVFVFWEPSQI